MREQNQTVTSGFKSLFDDLESVISGTKARALASKDSQNVPAYPTEIALRYGRAFFHELISRAHARDKAEVAIRPLSSEERQVFKTLAKKYQLELENSRMDKATAELSDEFVDYTDIAQHIFNRIPEKYRLSHFDQETSFCGISIDVSGCRIDLLFPNTKEMKEFVHLDIALIQVLLQNKLRLLAEAGVTFQNPDEQRSVIMILLLPHDKSAKQADSLGQVIPFENPGENPLALVELPVAHRAIYGHEIMHIIELQLSHGISKSHTLTEGIASYYGDQDSLPHGDMARNFKTAVVRDWGNVLQKKLPDLPIDSLGLTGASLAGFSPEENYNLNYLYGSLFVEFFIRHFGEEKLWRLHRMSTDNPNHLGEEDLVRKILADHPELLESDSRHYTVEDFRRAFEQHVRTQLDNSWKQRLGKISRKLMQFVASRFPQKEEKSPSAGSVPEEQPESVGDNTLEPTSEKPSSRKILTEVISPASGPRTYEMVRNPVDGSLTPDQYRRNYIEVVKFIQKEIYDASSDATKWFESFFPAIHKLMSTDGYAGFSVDSLDMLAPGEYRADAQIIFSNPDLVTISENIFFADMVNDRNKGSWPVADNFRARDDLSDLYRQGVMNNGAFFYPGPEYIKPAIEQVRIHLLKAIQSDNLDEIVAETGQAYWFIRYHPFNGVNNSVFMALVNTVLGMKGLNKLPHLLLDFNCHALSQESFTQVFKWHYDNFAESATDNVQANKARTNLEKYIQWRNHQNEILGKDFHQPYQDGDAVSSAKEWLEASGNDRSSLIESCPASYPDFALVARAFFLESGFGLP